MKTPDEIKKGLELCISGVYDCCRCSYHEVGNGDCVTDVKCDALAYIQQLEAERDALMEQAKYAGVCDMCKHEHTPLNELPCKECSLSNRKFEWHGVQRED